jgi:hypothetical protein
VEDANKESLERFARESAGWPDPKKPYKNPPPDNVEGHVLKLDEEAGWITVAVGSDSGVTKGHTLDVFRLKPRPTFLGTLLVLEVRPNEAVGKLTSGHPSERIQEGDRVVAKILDP